jgi:bifunctional UDP-N-acetylglucosamine pyrophosphorylase/glucosamine-1-phosphate N-acetyltransferase
MALNEDINNIEQDLKELSDRIDPSNNEVSVILAAGHGQRIKSEKSKMLHEIWGKPSVLRVSEAATNGLSSPNQVIVVGKKALEVARALGKKKNRIFVYQKEQKGTGDAVKIAVEDEALSDFTGNVYVFPGDMGLLTARTVGQFKKNFESSNCDMFVLTGFFEGRRASDNYYGRIIKSENHANEVIEIKEYKDIAAMESGATYTVSYKDRDETFGRDQLLAIKEFNTGVYAFRIGPVKQLINLITPDNVQGEIYVTDLIKIFNDRGHRVGTSGVENNSLAVAFNVKSVLINMKATFRDMIYERLKDIITIEDAEDFYIAEEIVEDIVKMDEESSPLDIQVGAGASIGREIKINRGMSIDRNSQLRGNVHLGKNVKIGENVILSTYPNQTLEIGDNTQILRGNVIQGEVKLGDNVRIETGVRITGSSSNPVVIGNNVLIKGVTYIFGSIIEEELLIVHSILKNMHVEKVEKKNGEIQPVKYIFPHPEGLDSITPIKKNS